jgi:hypothetical protein
MAGLTLPWSSNIRFISLLHRGVAHWEGDVSPPSVSGYIASTSMTRMQRPLHASFNGARYTPPLFAHPSRRFPFCT